jgi:tetratricopeptide (TPR) repeat protein
LNALLVVSALVAATPVPSPQAQSDFSRGELSLVANRPDDAVAAYQAAISQAPGYARAMNGLGSALFRLNKREEAMEQFKNAIAADPTVELAYFNLGYCARKLGEFPTAVTAYEQYVKLAPKDADGFYGLGESYRQTGKPQEAIGAFEKFVSLSSEVKWVEKAKAIVGDLKAELAKPKVAEVAQAPAAETDKRAPAAGPTAPAPQSEQIGAAGAKVAAPAPAEKT